MYDKIILYTGYIIFLCFICEAETSPPGRERPSGWNFLQLRENGQFNHLLCWWKLARNTWEDWRKAGAVWLRGCHYHGHIYCTLFVLWSIETGRPGAAISLTIEEAFRAVNKDGHLLHTAANTRPPSWHTQRTSSNGSTQWWLHLIPSLSNHFLHYRNIMRPNIQVTLNRDTSFVIYFNWYNKR